MTKPRSDVIVRRFLAGENIIDLVEFCADKGLSNRDAEAHAEGCIRRALNRKRAKVRR